MYNENIVTGEFWEISPSGPSLWDREKLVRSGYKNPSKTEYYVYSLIESNSPEFFDCQWKISKLNGFNKDKKPFAVSLLELMKAKEKNNSHNL